MSTGASYGYSQQPSYGMGGMGGMYGSYNPYQMGGMGGYGGQYNPYGMSNYGMSNPYAQMGFGSNYSTGYTDPFASSFSNPFSGGYGTTFGGYGGGMGGYNPFGGYGQVGLGYLPPQQPTINDAVANQFMQQYYGGAFGLGAQPQPRRQRPRNPFRTRPEAQPFVQPAPDLAPAVMPDYRTGPEAPVDVSGMSFANSQPSVVNPMPFEYAGPTNQMPQYGGPGLGPPQLEQLGLSGRGALLDSMSYAGAVEPSRGIPMHPLAGWNA